MNWITLPVFSSELEALAPKFPAEIALLAMRVKLAGELELEGYVPFAVIDLKFGVFLISTPKLRVIAVQTGGRSKERTLVMAQDSASRWTAMLRKQLAREAARRLGFPAVAVAVS